MNKSLVDVFEPLVDSYPCETKSKDKFISIEVTEDNKINLKSKYYELSNALDDILNSNNIINQSIYYSDILNNIGFDLVNKEGKYIKRLEKYLNTELINQVYDSTKICRDFDSYNYRWYYVNKITGEKYRQFDDIPKDCRIKKIKLTDKSKNILSDAIKDIANYNKATSTMFDFSTENYKNGKYYDGCSFTGGSCLWNGYNDGRLDFLNSGGFFIRRYVNDKPVGRCIGFFYGDKLIIFNEYDYQGYTLQNYARLIVNYLHSIGLTDYDYKYNAYVHSHAIYINGSAIQIGENLSSRDLTIDIDDYLELDSNRECCCCCDEYYHPDDMYTDANGNSICQSCWDEYYTECEYCNEVHHIDNMTRDIDGNSICDYCLRNHYTQCDNCGEFQHNDDIAEVYINGSHHADYCTNCIP